jgi:hypothetical protein
MEIVERARRGNSLVKRPLRWMGKRTMKISAVGMNVGIVIWCFVLEFCGVGLMRRDGTVSTQSSAFSTSIISSPAYRVHKRLHEHLDR